MKTTNACEICGDTPGKVRVACAKCRKDKANREWVAQIDAEQSTPIPQRWVVSDLERRIARELLFGDGSMRGAAKALGLKPEQVRWFVTACCPTGVATGGAATAPARRCRRPRLHALGTSGNRACDIDLAMYACAACGWYGCRNTVTGAIKPMETEPEGARPAPTVGFKQKWSPNDQRRLQQALPRDRQEGESTMMTDDTKKRSPNWWAHARTFASRPRRFH